MGLVLVIKHSKAESPKISPPLHLLTCPATRSVLETSTRGHELPAQGVSHAILSFCILPSLDLKKRGDQPGVPVFIFSSNSVDQVADPPWRQ